MKKTNHNGFTLVEVLIVVVIIGILISIAIPIFNMKLEKSREAYDIATMRQAASAAVGLYYTGVHDATSAAKANLGWSDVTGDDRDNAYGAYDPWTGKFYSERKYLPDYATTYGKGTTANAKTEFPSSNPNGAYNPALDYTNAVVMVAIYPKGNNPHVDVFWKNNRGNTNYVGGQGNTSNVPKYSMRIYIN